MKRGTPVVVEYWPKGLQAQSALELFETLVSDNYRSVVDLRVLSDGTFPRQPSPPPRFGVCGDTTWMKNSPTCSC